MVTYSLEVFYLDGDKVRRFPASLYKKLTLGPERYAAVQFASQILRISVSNVKYVDDRPIEASEPSFDVLHFDAEGYVDHELLLSQYGARLRLLVAAKRKVDQDEIPERIRLRALESYWTPDSATRQEIMELTMSPAGLRSVKAA